ncbi:hypothetical protein T459_30541 [Capsicum annuum]|uniref:Serine/threonine-protein phosphatase 2A 55 kDa regulatory subunit B n=1 Tax=Capsicum annuum TaxID=4072 RepID=A0A2G2Y8M9_CAPAN|nr:hypothetical protein T459_30541 [Capsicum annuum]
MQVDIISAIEFDKTGDHLATGDRGGRVVLFERTDTKEHVGNRRELERVDYPVSRHPEFRYKTEFQSHEPEDIMKVSITGGLPFQIAIEGDKPIVGARSGAGRESSELYVVDDDKLGVVTP